MSNQDESKAIYTSDGMKIPWFSKDINNHLDLSTLIFGASGSGKTYVINQILELLTDYCPNYLVIAPPTSDAPYRKLLPSRCIKDNLTKKKLEKIWKRQTYLTQLYTIANNLETLKKLFTRCADRESIIMYKAVKSKCSDFISKVERSNLDFGSKKAKKEEIEKISDARLKLIYRDTIKKKLSYFQKNMNDLSDAEKIAVMFFDLNPRFTLVIEDSSELFKTWMKYFKKDEPNIFESILYRGRHNFITLIIAAHDDTIIDPKLRKNARVVIYTTSQALVTSINKQANGFTTKEKKDMMKCASRIFVDEKKEIKLHQKFCYVREDTEPFKYMIAELNKNYRLGCSALYNLIDKLPKKDDILSENPYIKEINKKGSLFKF